MTRTQDLFDQNHEHEQLKEAYELAVATLFGETAMTFVPLPGSLEIVNVAPICSARSFIPSRPTPPLVLPTTSLCRCRFVRLIFTSVLLFIDTGERPRRG